MHYYSSLPLVNNANDRLQCSLETDLFVIQLKWTAFTAKILQLGVFLHTKLLILKKGISVLYEIAIERLQQIKPYYTPVILRSA